MNWMTSAKNRLQRSKKSKNTHNLWMEASSKLRTPQGRNSVVMHNFTMPTGRIERNRMVSRTQSDDVWMLNNSSRDRQQTTAAALEPKNNNELLSPIPSKRSVDPLQDLDITPAKHSEDIYEEQQITYYNDGHLCDELGNLLLTVPDRQPPVQNITPRKRLFSPVSERTPTHTEAGKRDSPVFDIHTDSDDWWHRLLDMLGSAGLEALHLHTVLAEIAATTHASDVTSMIQAAEMLQPPTPREALNALYRALSKVGRDPRASLAVFDAIRMLELVDKQHTDTDSTRTTTARTTATSTSIPTSNSTVHNNSTTAHYTAKHSSDIEWNLFDAPVPTTTTNKTNTNNNAHTNPILHTATILPTDPPYKGNNTIVITAKRKLPTEYTTSNENIHNNTNSTNNTTINANNTTDRVDNTNRADMELRLEDLF